jgi:ATP-dependent RNA helicase DeaD
MGFEEPTPIQSLAIPRILSGSDVIGQAQTGTGKTAAFGIPAVGSINADNRRTQVLVLSPTRELAIQTAEELSRLAKYLRGIMVVPVYGGQPIERQFRALKAGAQIVVGTPGRLIDHLDRGTLSLDAVTLVVLDEADQMLDMGFRDDIEAILSDTPRTRQTVLFSATMPKPILEITGRFQKNPEFVRVEHRELTVPQVEQLYLEVRNRDKLEVLCRLLDIYDPALTLVFCNTKRGVDELTPHLLNRGYRAEGLHGDLKQSQRDRVMGKFRSRAIEVLIATDVAARGIDVDDVDLVINYDVPQDVEYYIHRIGRTARAGRSGRAVTFTDPKEIYKLRTIQKYARINIGRIPVPTAGDVAQTRINHLLERVKQTVEAGSIDRYVELVERVMVDDYTSVDIAAALLKMELESGAGAPEGPDTVARDAGAEPGMVRLYLNFGHDQKIRPKDIVGAIAGETGLPGRSIGAISIFSDYSVVEVPQDDAGMVVERMKGKGIGPVRLIQGRSLSAEPPQRDPGRQKYRR